MRRHLAILVVVGFLISIFLAMYTQRLEIWLVGLAVAFVFLKVNSFLEAREENDS